MSTAGRHHQNIIKRRGGQHHRNSVVSFTGMGGQYESEYTKLNKLVFLSKIFSHV
jgi:hypothetical protein